MTTVATFNILHGLDLASGEPRLDLDAVARTIASLEADVVALQEVDRNLPRSGGVDQVAWLASALGWSGAFAPALLGDPDRRWSVAPDPDPGGPAYGIGLLSRTPILRREQVTLPGGGPGQRKRSASPSRPGWDREPRVALSCLVERDDGALSVTTTHLSYLPWRGVAQLRVAAQGPPWGSSEVLLGDLNLPPLMVRAALPKWDHHTAPPSYPAWRPRARIDQVLTRGLAVDAVRVAAETTSDHLPVIAELRP